MNKITKIKVPEGTNYLNEVTEIVTLPHNSIFDKGKVGCGGTTIAIESDKPYIICVPFVTLIENKIGQYPNERYTDEIYGFYGGNNLKKDLNAYLNRVEVPKIMVTYDSLKKLSKWINPEEYYILIDELHLLFTEYSYRSAAVREVLEVYKFFKSFCFMTATPLEEDFILEELKDIPVVEAIWDNTKIITVQSVKVDGKVKDAVSGLVNDFINNKFAGNAYFFVNSVSYIKDIVTDCGLTEENTRVIYSKNNKNKIQVGIKRGSSLDKPKKINLITSTAFEGSDFYDENGLIFIISDSAETQTLIDISTKFQQIAGRIRNSKYSDKIYHIYKQTRYSELSYEDYKEFVNTTISETKKFIKNNSGESYVNKIKEDSDLFDTFYFQKEGDNLFFDANKVKIDLYQYKITRNIYSLRINLINEYKKYNYEVENFDLTPQYIKRIGNTSLSFKDVVLKVKEELEYKEYNQFHFDSKMLSEAFIKYPFLEEAIEKLGFDEMEKMKYNITNIKEKLIVRSDIGLEAKINNALNNRFKPVIGDFVKASEVTNILEKIYENLGIDKTVKSTDIKKYYNVQDKTKKIDGKQHRGYIILGKKLIIK